MPVRSPHRPGRQQNGLIDERFNALARFGALLGSP
jgi:hypothetical protein